MATEISTMEEKSTNPLEETRVWLFYNAETTKRSPCLLKIEAIHIHNCMVEQNSFLFLSSFGRTMRNKQETNDKREKSQNSNYQDPIKIFLGCLLWQTLHHNCHTWNLQVEEMVIPVNTYFGVNIQDSNMINLLCIPL